MAKIIYGAAITEMKGSIGGITFQKNGSGTIARLKPRKPKTNTIKQREQQPRLKEIQSEWQKLSLEHRLNWNTFADNYNKIGLNGQSKKLTGYQWFLTINENRTLVNQPILLNPPAYQIVNPIADVYILWNGTTLGVEFDPAINGNLYATMIYFSFVLKSVSKFNFNDCRLIRTYTNNGNYSDLNIQGSGSNYWSDYFNSSFPPHLGNQSFYLMMCVRLISKTSGISSLGYTRIVRFIWNGTNYVLEEF